MRALHRWKILNISADNILCFCSNTKMRLFSVPYTVVHLAQTIFICYSLKTVKLFKAETVMEE